jgi:MULE transposase domain
MANATVYVAELPWTPNSLCPPHIVPILEQAVLALPPSFLIPPAKGEMFEGKDDCLKRLQGYALSTGFAVVQSSGGRGSEPPRFQFRCIHHGVETHNSRELEENVEYNNKGEIVTQRRQQATATQQKACRWQVYLSWKDVGVRGSNIKGFVLGITNNTHSHPPAANPLRYKAHERALETYKEAKRIAQAHRESFLSYSDSQRILDRTGYSLDRHTYYNIRHRLMSSISSESDLFSGLVAALEEAEFKYSLRFEEITDSTSSVVDRQLQQIFFIHPEQIHLGQRFLPDFVFLIDGTFNTNNLNLILISIVGIDNQDHTVPVAMSFARSESKVSFDFVFKAIDEWIFKPKTLLVELPPSRVCISDQAAGLHASALLAIPHTKT